MTGWRAVWIVARWEFTTAVMRAGFVLTLLGLPMAHVGLVALIAISARVTAVPAGTSRPIVVVDEHQVLRDAVEGHDRVRRNEIEAMRDLSNDLVEAVFVVDRDYPQTGRVRAYAPPPRGLQHLARRDTQRERAGALIRRGLVGSSFPDAQGDRLVEPLASVAHFEISSNGVRPESAFPVLALFAGPFGIAFALGLAIFLSAGLLEHVTSAELQNRTLEVLLSITTPLRLLAGKVLGLGAAGLLQVGVYTAATFGALPLLGMATVPPGDVLWYAAIFLAGFLLFAVILATTGALVRDAREGPQIASIVMLVAALPFFFVVHISAHGRSILSRTLTWFPPTAPVTLLLREATDSIGAFERSAALAFVVVATIAMLHLAARMLAAWMDGGGRVTLRSLRAAFGGRP